MSAQKAGILAALSAVALIVTGCGKVEDNKNYKHLPSVSTPSKKTLDELLPYASLIRFDKETGITIQSDLKITDKDVLESAEKRLLKDPSYIKALKEFENASPFHKETAAKNERITREATLERLVRQLKNEKTEQFHTKRAAAEKFAGKIIAQDTIAERLIYDWKTRTISLHSEAPQTEARYAILGRRYALIQMDTEEEAQQFNALIQSKKIPQPSGSPLNCHALNVQNDFDFFLRINSEGPFGTDVLYISTSTWKGEPSSWWLKPRMANPTYGYLSPIYSFDRTQRMHSSEFHDAFGGIRDSDISYSSKDEIRAKITAAADPKPAPLFKITSLEILGCNGELLGTVQDNRFVPNRAALKGPAPQ
jgi:hypothetical protein